MLFMYLSKFTSFLYYWKTVQEDCVAITERGNHVRRLSKSVFHPSQELLESDHHLDEQRGGRDSWFLSSPNISILFSSAKLLWSIISGRCFGNLTLWIILLIWKIGLTLNTMSFKVFWWGAPKQFRALLTYHHFLVRNNNANESYY